MLAGESPRTENKLKGPRAGPAPQMARQHIDRRRTPRPQVIVVAEDAEALRELWKQWLGSLDFEVLTASTGAEALALATN